LWWAKGMAAKDIHKEMLPMYGEHCLSRQAVSNWVQKGEKVSKTNIELVGRWRLQRPRFPATCEMVGQVFKFVWRLCLKINVVCMSLPPFVSFQSLFVTYLLTFSRTFLISVSR
jgi:hypothetical protein